VNGSLLKIRKLASTFLIVCLALLLFPALPNFAGAQPAEWVLVERGANFERWFNGTHYRWVSAPQWVWNGSAYVPYILNYNAAEDCYVVQAGLIGAKIYSNHVEFYDPSLTRVAVWDEHWVVWKYSALLKKWVPVLSQTKLSFDSSSYVEAEDYVNVTMRYSNSFGFLNITYHFRERLKHDVRFSPANNGTYMVTQVWLGIVYNKIKLENQTVLYSGENVTISSADSATFLFFNDTQPFGIYESQAMEKKFVKVIIGNATFNGKEYCAASYVFGNWTLANGESLTIDPATITLQPPVEDISATANSYGARGTSWIKFDISSIPSANILEVYLKCWVVEWESDCDGDVKFANTHNQTWTETSPGNLHTASISNVITQSNFATGYDQWANSTNIKSIFEVDYNASHQYLTIRLSDPDLDDISSGSVYEWYNGEDLIIGQPSAYSGYGYFRVASSEYSDPAKAPKLEVIYELIAPTLNSPPENARFNPSASVEFTWNFSGQSSYQFQLDDNSDFSSPIIDTGKVSSSTPKTVQTLPSTVGLYYWRVKVWDSQDAESPWSNRTIIVDKLNVTFAVSPENPQAGDKITLSWTIKREYDGSTVTNFTIDIARDGALWMEDLTVNNITDYEEEETSHTYDVYAGTVVDLDYGLNTWDSTPITVTWSGTGGGGGGGGGSLPPAPEETPAPTPPSEVTPPMAPSNLVVVGVLIIVGIVGFAVASSEAKPKISVSRRKWSSSRRRALKKRVKWKKPKTKAVRWRREKTWE